MAFLAHLVERRYVIAVRHLVQTLLAVVALSPACAGSSNVATGSNFACSNTQSLSDYCSPSCAPWPADIKSFCGTGVRSVVEGCDGYDVAIDHFVDTGTAYYYSASSGALVAVMSYGVSVRQTRCIAGPPGFVDPGCWRQNQVEIPCVGDAGSD